MKLINKNFKGSGKCKSCDDYKMNSMWYKWYSPFDGRLIFDMICRKCAQREIGSKRKNKLKEL